MQLLSVSISVGVTPTPKQISDAGLKPMLERIQDAALYTLTKDNTTSNNTSNSSKPGATQFSIGSFELVYWNQLLLLYTHRCIVC